MARMSLRGRGRALRALCVLAGVAALGTAATACDDSGESPVEDPTPSVDGTPPSDRDSYRVTEIDFSAPAGSPAPVADRVLRVGAQYVLLGHDAEQEDGSIWISPDLASWKARGGWIAGYAGVQRVVGLVQHEGRWIGAYNERPAGMPAMAWHLSSSDAGQNWHEDALPGPTSHPSTASGVVTVGDRVVVTGAHNEGETEQPIERPVAWRTSDGKKWNKVSLASDENRSVAPNEPFLIDQTVFVPGAAVAYEGDELVSSKPLLWTSDDGGRTFKRTELPQNGDRAVPLFGLHTNQADFIFGWSGSDAIVWRSEDDGRTWQAAPDSTFAHRPEGQSYPHQAIRDGDCVVLAGVIGDPTANEPLPSAMWRSCDAGKSWSRMATDELEDADATDTVDLVGDGLGMVLVTNSSSDETVRLLRLQK